jgi:hypothetical protein
LADPCCAQNNKEIQNHYDEITTNIHYTPQEKLDSLIAECPRPFVAQYGNVLLSQMGGSMPLVMLRKVLEYGANPNGTGKYDVPIFHFPRSAGGILRAGSNTSRCGQVQHADCSDDVFRQQTGYIELLIQYGAKWDTISPDHRNLMLLAAQFNELRLLRYLVGRNRGKLIGPDYTYLDEPLHLGFIDIVKYMIEEKDVDINTMLPGNNSLLSRTVGIPELGDYLIHKGINVNTANDGGWTPLMLTIEQGCIASVELLLNAGADRNALTQKREDILDIARLYSHDKEMVKYVRQHRKDQPPL